VNVRTPLLLLLVAGCYGYGPKTEDSAIDTSADTDTDTDSDTDADSDTDTDTDTDADSDTDTDTDTGLTDADGDGYYAEVDDCDDGDRLVNPDAPEFCDDRVDNDCDGDVDENDAINAHDYCEDLDGDGFGNASSLVHGCRRPPDTVENCEDCDDTDATVLACEDGGDDQSVCMTRVGIADGRVPAWSGTCDTGAGYVSFGGHFYYSVSAAGTVWEDARASCIESGMHLVTVTSSAEDAFVATLQGHPALGACDVDHEGTFLWVTGETWGYENWAPSQPDDAGTGEDCLLQDAGSWYDEPCLSNATSTGYVCEQDMGDTGGGDTGDTGTTDTGSTDTGTTDTGTTDTGSTSRMARFAGECEPA
jgi:hypothetical protein